LLVGGAGLHLWLDAESRGPRQAERAAHATERGELLVVAHPWAHVFVDGQKFETTPFATPIQLGAGVHHVRLEHPSAPPERREIELRPAERIVLEVSMNLGQALPDAGAGELLEPETARDAGSASP
jgi:serine/threonine-protein kinase